jgi:hypothetical protein
MRWHRPVVVGAAAVLAALAAVPRLPAQDAPPDLSGVWQGTLTNVSAHAGAAPVNVTMEIGALPADSGCAPWRTVYAEGGTVRQVKDYRWSPAASSGSSSGDGRSDMWRLPSYIQ